MAKKLQEPFASTDCTEKPTLTKAGRTTVACDDEDQKYLLGPAVVTGGIATVNAIKFEGEWVVAIVVDKATQKEFASFTDEGDDPTIIAFERDGVVLDARGIDQLVLKGRTSIRGDLTEERAKELATELTASVEKE